MRAKIKDYKSVEDLMKDFTKVQIRFSKISKVLKSIKKFLHIAGVLDYYIEESAGATGITVRGKGANKLKRSKTRAPKLNMKDLISKFSSMSELQDEGEELENMVEYLKARGNPKASGALKEVEKLYNKVTVELNSVWDLIGSIAKKNMSPTMEKIGSEVATGLLERLDDSLEEMTTDFQVAPFDDTIHFVHYFIMSNLKDDSGFTYDEFYVMITEVIHTKKASAPEYYVNTSNKYLIPGRFRLSVKISDTNKALQTVGNIMSAQKFIAVISPTKVPVPDIKFTNDMVKKTTLSSNMEAIFIELYSSKIKNAAQLDAVILDLVLELKAIMKRAFPRNKDMVLWRKLRKPNMLEFRLSPPTDTRTALLDQDYKKLKVILDLTDSQVKQVRKSLEGR